MKATLVHFVPWLFAENIAADRGTLETTVQATWSVAPGIILLILLVTAVVIFMLYWYERPSANRRSKAMLAGVRTVLVAIVLTMLYGWTVQRHRTDLPDVVIILDDSASMSLVDSFDDSALSAEIRRRLSRLKLDKPSRFNLAEALLLDRDGELLEALGRRYHLRCYLAGESARPIASDKSELLSAIKQASPQEPASRLGNCVHDVLEAQRGRPTAAIILLTDGLTTDGKSLTNAAQYARRKSVPLFFVGLGSDRPERDLKIEDLLAEDAAFIGDTLHFDIKLRAEGYTGSAALRLMRKGLPETLAEATVTFGKTSQSQSIRLTHRADEPGEFEYVVEIVPRAGEANLENNRRTRTVVVRDEILRVLLVQAYPSFEFRFLKQMLLRELNRNQPGDETAAGFRTVLQEADLEYSEADKTGERAFPANREALFQYDVLIFGDVNPSLLSPSIMNNIYEFVTVRGGSVIFIAGPRYTPLAYRDTPIAALLPMSLDTVSVPDSDAGTTEPFRPRLTPLGLASPMMQIADRGIDNERLWNEQLPPLRWLATMPDLRAGVRVLAEHPTRRGNGGAALPVITLHFLGAGKVVFHATDETYRWRFRVGDVYFARYWVQTIRTLCRSKLLADDRGVELVTDREQYHRGDEVNLRVRFLDDRAAPAADDGVMVVVERNTEGNGMEGNPAQRRNVTLHRHASERGLFEGTAGPLEDGTYRAWLAAPSIPGSPPSRRLQVAGPPGEFLTTQMNSTELREAAKISFGKFYTFATANSLLSDLPPGRQIRIDSLPPTPIWNTPWLASLFVGLIAAEWFLRKRSGLL